MQRVQAEETLRQDIKKVGFARDISTKYTNSVFRVLSIFLYVLFIQRLIS